jgi:hypothetical protein
MRATEDQSRLPNDRSGTPRGRLDNKNNDDAAPSGALRI